MYETIRLLLFPAIIVAGWLTSAQRTEATRKAVRVMALFSAALFVCIVASGLLRNHGPSSLAHRWGSHILLVALWLMTPFAIGVAVQRNIPSRPTIATLHSLILLALLGMSTLASFTGYLGPSYIPQAAEETRNRFNTLHCVALPLAVGVALAGCFWAFRTVPVPYDDSSSDL